MKWKQFAKVSVWINSICWDTQGAGLLAIEYALKYQEHLKGLVISNMAASADSFVKHVSKLRAQFPADVRAKLEFYENADKTDDPAYQRLLFDKVYKIFICRDLEDLRRMATLIPHGEAWTSETGSHFAMYDDQHNYFKALLAFLKG